MSFHALSTGADNHAITANTYADITSRDADTDWQITENIDKMVRVLSPPGYFALLSVGPSVFKEMSSDVSGTIDFAQFSLVANNPAHQEGLLFYDNSEETLSFYVKEADVTLNIGEEQWIKVRNASGATIPDGQVVYISGSQSDRAKIDLAQADAIPTAATIGLTTHSIENNTDGYVTISGVVNSLNTSAFTAGDVVYVSPSVAGGMTNTVPSEGEYSVKIGIVARSHASQGKILVHPEQVLPLTAGEFASLLTTGSPTFANLTLTGDFKSDAAGNTRIGTEAGELSTSNPMTAIGYKALKLATGAGNTALGYLAGEKTTTGTGNTFIGFEAGLFKTTGIGSTAIGYRAGLSTISNPLTAVGFEALEFSEAAGNTAVGYQAAFRTVGASGVTAIGHLAATTMVSNDITAVGFNALTLSTGLRNTAVGYQAGLVVAAGTNNTLMGHNAGVALAGGSYSTIIGSMAGILQVSNPMTAIGFEALEFATNPGNTAVGYQAGRAIVGGNSNTIVGHQAGTTMTSGSGSTIVGSEAGKSMSTSPLTAIGSEALKLSTGVSNTAVGYQSMKASVGGAFNTAVGHLTLVANVGGAVNNAFGSAALTSNVSGNNNVGIGNTTLALNETGDDNVAVGVLAANVYLGSGITAIGYAALTLATGISNTALGHRAGEAITTGSNNLVLGFGADTSAVGASNEIVIGNASNTKTLLRGDVTGGSFNVAALNTAPATATSTGTLGEIRFTATHMYLCTATNVWVRTALTSW